MNREDVLKKNEANIGEFRANGGRIASFGEAPLLLLTTSGARSGQARTSPLMYLADEHDPNRVYIFAAYAGAETNPAWYHNLVAHPQQVSVEVGRELVTASAEVLRDARRAELYAIQASRYPRFADYQAMTTRSIPVVALTLRR